MLKNASLSTTFSRLQAWDFVKNHAFLSFQTPHTRMEPTLAHTRAGRPPNGRLKAGQKASRGKPVLMRYQGLFQTVTSQRPKRIDSWNCGRFIICKGLSFDCSNLMPHELAFFYVLFSLSLLACLPVHGKSLSIWFGRLWTPLFWFFHDILELQIC